jgi:hypothetical protein
VEGRFVDNGDGTVTDTCTGLVWQQATADINDDGLADLVHDGLTWEGALEYCENLVLGGQEDWRLPNIRELQSIVDYGRWGPSVDPSFNLAWDTTWASCYWSSTTLVQNPVAAFGVSWYHGFVHYGTKNNRRYVLAVRG